MPIIFQKDISENTKLALWDISEDEYFFSNFVKPNGDIAHPYKRLQTMAGRNLLIQLFPDLPINLVEIAPTRKPFIPGDPFHFSISHCRNYAAAIVSRTKRVGVDVELAGERIFKIRDKFLTENEQTLLSDLSSAHLYNLKLTICWSIKEAMFKWYGKGEIDFKTNLIIQSLKIMHDSFEAKCLFKKEFEQELYFEGKLFGDICLAWVVGNK